MSDTPTPQKLADLIKQMKQDSDNAAGHYFVPPHVWSALAAHMHEPDKLETLWQSLIDSGAIKLVLHGGAE
jgi:hypothetical protein